MLAVLRVMQFLAQEPHVEETTDPARFVLPHGDELLWGSIAFFVLFGFLAWKVFPAINKMLAERQAKIRSGLESSEKAKAEAERLQDQYRKQLDEARGEASKIIEEAKRTAEAVRQDMIAKAEQEAQEIMQRARADVAGEAQRARQALQAELVNLSLELATRVIERELSNPEQQRQFVERTMEELTSLAASSGGGNGNGHS